MEIKEQSGLRQVLAGTPLPKMCKVRQIFKRDGIEDVPAYLQKKLDDPKLRARIKPGMRVVLTGSSRQIANMSVILRKLAQFVKEQGAQPYIIPAMGSHGGATDEGQRQILESYGITEEFCGCPIFSSMETVRVGELPNGDEVRVDKFAHDADAVIVVGRIKAHTAFRGPYESGLIKMMAIGMGKMLGFHFPENFDYPYTAASVTEFWRRWHISLTTWFREYLYIPLGGSRKGTWRTVRNIFLVWFCTGFWHGASWNFILWGLHFFVWLMLEKYLLRDFLQKLPSWLRHFYTLVVVFVGWGVFAMEDLTVCAGYFKTCFGSGTLWSAADGYYLIAYGLTLLLLTVGSTRLPRKVWNRLPERARDLLGPLLMAAGLVICTAYLVDGSYNPFLYFRF